MKLKSRLSLIISVLLFSYQESVVEYVCTPCDLPCDTLSFTKPGICPHCKMTLLKKSEIIDESNLVINEINIKTDSGVFLIEGDTNRIEKTVKIYYHKPRNYTDTSKILLVIPGAGRNGDSYRDAWVEASEKYGILILSPKYSEEDYSFEEYHLCGLIKESNLDTSVEFVDDTNIAKLNEEVFNFEVNTEHTELLFNDFDRIFNVVVNSTGSLETEYDIFGHSAGGQILHRLAIFQATSKADRIIAANAGFYTVPNFDIELPFGIKNTLLNNEKLALSFHKNLILLIGELDNENEQGGTLLRSISVDKQGVHRLERGKYFYDFSKKSALTLGADYNWKIQIVPNVGHNHEQMGNAAAKLLYE